MPSRGTIIKAIIVVMVLVIVGEHWTRCYEINDYVFTAEAGQSSLGDGETTELKFAFYPARDRRITFHAAPDEQFHLWSSEPVDDRPPVILPARKSPQKTRIYGKTRPLTISIPVTRIDREDGTVLLDFGKFGTISTRRDSTIELAAHLYPALTCYFSSNEGFGSEYIMLRLE